jgi:hypothetical protein
MTTNAINCEVFNDRLMAYLEHETDDAARVALERHALSCDDCGALLADLRQLRVDAANLPERAPSRDLWTGIAARIETPVVSIGRPAGAVPSPRLRRWVSAAAIAASLVAAAGLGYVAASSDRADANGTLAATPPDSILDPVVVAISDTPASAPAALSDGPTTAPAALSEGPIAARQSARAQVASAAPRAAESPGTSAQLAVAALTADYNREVLRLRRLIDERRNQLDPVTVAIIERNLQVIDTAIADCQRAIERDPSSRFLIESLNQSLQTKVELMRTAALLPSRT